MPSPRPTPSRRAVAVSRRAALLGLAGTTATACSPYELQTQRRRPRPSPTPTTAETPATDPDIPLASAVVTAEQALLTRIEATVRRHPRLEDLLAATREVHDAHVRLLEDAVPAESGASATPDPQLDATSSGSTPSAVPTEAGVPRDRVRALRALATAEDELALTAKQAAFAAESGAFARVLASLAAAAAQQSAVLRTARVAGGRR